MCMQRDFSVTMNFYKTQIFQNYVDCLLLHVNGTHFLSGARRLESCCI